MAVALLDSREASQFRDVAGRYCALIERSSSLSTAELLVALEPLLALLYHAGATLPEIEPATDRSEESGVAGTPEVERTLGALCGERDYDREVFDPADPADRDPVGGTLSGDLAEIYQDLREALALAQPSRGIQPADVLWDWRFGFTSHWGRHAASALRVVNSLLHTHFVQA